MKKPATPSKPATTTVQANNDGVTMATVDGITGKLDGVLVLTREQLYTAMRDCAGELMDRAVKLCPAKTGELRSRSFMTTVKTDEQGNPEIYVGFEQFGAKTGRINNESAGKFYAIAVHERTNLTHDVGQAKFLEAARNEFADEFLDAMKKSIEMAQEGR